MYRLTFHEYKKEDGHFHKSDAVTAALEAFCGKPCEIYTDKNGKPLCDNAYFSISHTGDVALLAISDSPIGADMEKAARKMPAALSQFSICDWTDAEAAAKLLGKPIRALLGKIPAEVIISRFEKGALVISLAEYK